MNRHFHHFNGKISTWAVCFSFAFAAANPSRGRGNFSATTVSAVFVSRAENARAKINKNGAAPTPTKSGRNTLGGAKRTLRSEPPTYVTGEAATLNALVLTNGTFKSGTRNTQYTSANTSANTTNRAKTTSRSALALTITPTYPRSRPTARTDALGYGNCLTHSLLANGATA